MLPPKKKHPVFVHQHMYFQEATYRQDGVPEEDKDWDMVWMRNFSYNQVIMRSVMEIQLHKDHERDVEHPPAKTMRGNLEDFSKLDFLGAASLGRLIALKPEVKAILFPGENLPAALVDTTPRERARFFDDLLGRTVDELSSPIATPQIVVSSAMKRMAGLLGDKDLHAEADVRLAQEETYYPLRLPKLSTLYYLGNQLLIESVNRRTIPETEDERVPMVA